MKQDITLFYLGGSGGFFCLHLLLLTGKYQCVFQGKTQKLEDIMNHQWNISDIKNWKSNEIWPDNDVTLSADLDNKIYFICNNQEKISNYPGKKIALYTDIKTQWVLSRDKTAYWFSDITEDKVIAAEKTDFVQAYNVIKADSWPACNRIEDFNNLPEYIKIECNEKWKLNDTWDLVDTTDQRILEKHQENMSNIYNGDLVYFELIDIMKNIQFDIVIKLQDLIRTNGEILFEQLGITGNDKCKEFVKKWVNLHSEEHKKYLI